MIEQTNNSMPKASSLSKFTMLSTIILLVVVAMVIVSLYLYFNTIRFPEKSEDVQY